MIDFKLIEMVSHNTTLFNRKVGKVMSEYGHGNLHVHSKHGPLVRDRRQAIGIY
jgi:hypothetical protein